MPLLSETACITCGRSIPLGDTHCGGGCLNRYTSESEHPRYSHFDWRQAVAGQGTERGYHDWAVAEEETDPFPD